MNTTEFQGTARGRMIELDRELGLPEGQSVRVTVIPSSTNGISVNADSLERLRRAAGGWNDDTEGLEQFLEWNRQRRKSQRREIPG